MVEPQGIDSRRVCVEIRLDTNNLRLSQVLNLINAMKNTVSKNLLKYIWIALLLSISFLASSMTQKFPFIDIEVASKKLKVEYADTWERRAQGLQDRKFMCQECGMLFNFGNTRQVSMWMKDTYIPLDVAFITRDGNIVNIETMKPLDATSIRSKGKVLYALEMNQGWFKANGVRVGDEVMINELSD